MNRYFQKESSACESIGIRSSHLESAVNYVHRVINDIDSTLLEAGGERLAELVELANLSAIIGNLYRGGIVAASEGKFKANAPHTYPDILANCETCKDVEIKVALENNKPKGHLVKPGPHLIVRYVLTHSDQAYTPGKENRGTIPKIWEARLGFLEEQHFNFSNTEGDSGKTAVINAEGMTKLSPIIFNPDYTPISKKGKLFKEYKARFSF